MSIAQASKSRLRDNVHRFEEVLEKDTFLSRELDAPKDERQSIIELLVHTGAIKSVERKIPEQDKGDDLRNTKPVHTWKWVQYQDHLIEYLEERDELPCECRVHVPPEREAGKYVCKFCGARHDKQTIQQALGS